MNQILGLVESLSTEVSSKIASIENTVTKEMMDLLYLREVNTLVMMYFLILTWLKAMEGAK